MGRFLRIYLLIKNYGLYHGLKVFILLGRTWRIRIPGIKSQLFLRKRTADISVFQQIFINQKYDVDPACDPVTIIDAGANIGLASVFFANKYPEARIFAIEPEGENFKRLLKNTAHYTNITPVKAALWNVDDELDVIDHEFGEGGYMVGNNKAKSLSKTMALSIPHLMRAYNFKKIDVLKIDIEGAETELFSSHYEDWIPHVRTIFIELHDHIRKGASRQFFKTISEYPFSFQTRENILILRNENFRKMDTDRPDDYV